MTRAQPNVSLRQSLLGFCRYMRQRGYLVGVQESLDTLVVALEGITDYHLLKMSIRSMVCTNREEWGRFDVLFDEYWFSRGFIPRKRKPKKIGVPKEQQGIPLLMIGSDEKKEVEGEGSRTTGAQAIERLKKTDFAEIPEPDKKRLEALALRLFRQMQLNLSRRYKYANKEGYVDLRRTIRHSLGQGGVPLRMTFKSRKEKKNRLIALIDVSGSMDSYSYFMLLFIYAMQPHFEQVDTFLFSTRLSCVSDALKKKRFKEVMIQAGQLTDAWSSGTRIGDTFNTFIEQYGKRLLRRDALVFILSDGLDTGEPEILAKSLAHMKQRVKRMVWLNPLKGMKEYEPLAKGMQCALPYLDVFASAHNVESLLALEKTFRHV